MKLSRLLMTNTPMKLLTTIAAVLISISAYSQDYVEYDKGTFTQNGEQLSMEQIYDLTVLHKVGRSNVRRGINFDEMQKDKYLRSVNNTANFIGGAASGYVGGIGVLLTGLVVAQGDIIPGVFSVLLGATTGVCAVSYKAFSRIVLSKKGCLKRRDKKFNKVADKINQAIKAANQ